MKANHGMWILVASVVTLSATWMVMPWVYGVLLAGIVAVSVYAWELRARLKVIQNQQEWTHYAWAQAMEFLPDPMYVVDLNDKLVLANAAFYRQVGRTKESCLGRDVKTLLHLKPEDKPCPGCLARLERRDAFFTKERFDHTNPTGKPIEVTIRVIRDNRDAPIGILSGIRDLSHLRAAEEVLRISKERLNSAQQLAHIGSWELDLGGHQLHVSDEMSRLLGLPSDASCVDLDTYRSFVHEGDLARFDHTLEESIANESEIHLDYRLLMTDGALRIVHQHTAAMLTPAGKVQGVACTVQDVTEHKQYENALFEQKERAQVTLKSIGDAVITTDVNGFVDYMNPSAERISGVSIDHAMGKHCRNVFQVSDERTNAPIKDIVLRCLNTRSDCLHLDHNLLLRPDGSEVAVKITAAPMHDKQRQVTGVVIVFHDVTEMRTMARKLNYQASHDSLTGLINRREFEVRLAEAVDRSTIDRSENVLIYMDLDQFKIVNDSCGHAAGDELLKQVATLFQSRVRESDTLARIGGDEFAVLLHHCPVTKAQLIANAFLADIQDHKFFWDNRHFGIGVSIGMVVIDGATVSDRDVLGKADAACYVAKDRGRNRIQLFKDTDGEMLEHRGNMRWVNEINAAFDEHRFVLFIQEIAPLLAGTTCSHAEFLIRMRDRDGSIILPGQFLPAAERYGLMRAIDKWVVQTVFTELAVLARQKLLGRKIYSINLSGDTLSDPAMLQFITDQVGAGDFPAENICFEITETAAISNLGDVTRFMSRLQAQGVKFALDDFGSGLSSFAYLKELKVDFLKIDGSFVRDIVDDPVDYELVSTIHQIGKLMNIQTIAEFVESAAIFDKLASIGVDYVQGYHVSKPFLYDETRIVSDKGLTA